LDCKNSIGRNQYAPPTPSILLDWVHGPTTIERSKLSFALTHPEYQNFPQAHHNVAPTGLENYVGDDIDHFGANMCVHLRVAAVILDPTVHHHTSRNHQTLRFF
jgi:hypothetical protein